MIYAVLNPPTGRSRRRRGGRKARVKSPGRKGGRVARRSRRLSAGARRMSALVKKHHGDFRAAAAEYRGGSRNPKISGYKAKRAVGRGRRKRRKVSVKATWRRWFPKRRRGRFAKGRGAYSPPRGAWKAMWSKRKARKSTKRRKMARNPLLTFNRSRRRSRRRNPLMTFNRSRRSQRYRRYRRNPAMSGILAPMRKVMSMDNVLTATWTAGGAFATMTLPGLVRRFLPANIQMTLDKWTSGMIGGTLLDVASAGAVAGLSGMLPVRAVKARQKEIFAGAMLAVVIKAGARLIPNYFPLRLEAQPISVPGLKGLGQSNMIANRALARLNQGVQDFDTGMEDFDTGMEDYNSGLEDYASGADDFGTGIAANGSLEGLTQ